MAEIKAALTNIRGAAARIVEVTSETVPAGAPMAPVVSGPDQARTIHLYTERGLPGVNAIENDEAVAAYLGAADSETRNRADSLYQRVTNAAGFGVVMDPDAPQNDGIISAINASTRGSTITFPHGAMGVNGGWIEVPHDVTIDLSNVELVNLATFGGLRFRAPASPVLNMSSLATTTIPSNTETGISVSAPGVVATLSANVDWQAGDLVKLVSADELADQRVTEDPADTRRSWYGQTMVVHSVAGNVVTFIGVLRDFSRYVTNVRAAKRSDVRLTIVNPTWRVLPTTPGEQRLGIQLEGFTAPRLINPRMPSVYKGAITVRGCYGAVIDNPMIGYARDFPNTSDFGYGIYDEASEYTNVNGGVISHCRHAYTDGTPRGVVYEDVNFYGRTFGALIQGTHAYAIAATAWDTHLDGEGASFINVSADSCGQGSHFRGRNHRLQNARFSNISGNAISIADEGVQAGTSHGHVIDGVTVDGCSTVISAAGRATGHPLNGVALKQKSSISNVRADRVTSRAVYTANIPLTLNNIDATLISSMDGSIVAQGDLSRLFANNMRIKYEGFVMSTRFIRALNAATTMHIDGFTIEWDNMPTGTVYSSNDAAGGGNVTLLNGFLAGFVDYESSQAKVSYAVLNNDSRPGKLLAADADITISKVRRAVADMQAPTVVLNLANTTGTNINIPTLPNGTADGQQMVIMCRAGSTSTITQRNSTTGNADLIAGANKVLTAGQRMRLVWTGDIWLEV